MAVLESLGGMCSQELDGIVRAAWKRNCAVCLSKIIQILEEFRRASSFGNGFRMSYLHKLHERQDQIRPLQAEVPDHSADRIIRADSIFLHLAVHLRHVFQHR